MSNFLKGSCCVLACSIAMGVLVGGGCSSSSRQGIRGSGVVLRESRDVGSFSAVSLSGIGTVRLRQTGTQSLAIEAEDNIVPLLVTTVENGTLRIGVKPNANVRATRPVIFHVTVDRIEAVTVSGSGNVEGGDLKAETFTARVSGSGDVKLASLDAQKVAAHISGSGTLDVGRIDTRAFACDIVGSGDARLAGRADDVRLAVTGSGSLRAADLTCRAADVSIAGSGAAAIGTTADRVTADVSGSGSLRYRGTPPVVDSRVTGSGSVAHAGG